MKQNPAKALAYGADSDADDLAGMQAAPTKVPAVAKVPMRKITPKALKQLKAVRGKPRMQNV